MCREPGLNHYGEIAVLSVTMSNRGPRQALRPGWSTGRSRLLDGAKRTNSSPSQSQSFGVGLRYHLSASGQPGPISLDSPAARRPEPRGGLRKRARHTVGDGPQLNRCSPKRSDSHYFSSIGHTIPVSGVI